MKRRLGAAASVTRFILAGNLPARKRYFELGPAAERVKEEPAKPSKILQPAEETGGGVGRGDPSGQPLLPSPDMPGEGIAVQAGASTQFPRNYCPAVGPPGNGTASVLYEFRIAYR